MADSFSMHLALRCIEGMFTKEFVPIPGVRLDSMGRADLRAFGKRMQRVGGLIVAEADRQEEERNG